MLRHVAILNARLPDFLGRHASVPPVVRSRQSAALVAMAMATFLQTNAAVAQQPGTGPEPASQGPGATGPATPGPRQTRSAESGSLTGGPAAMGRAGRAAATPGPSFEVLNRSGRPITQLYANPVGLHQWGYDRLGSMAVPPNGRHVVRLQAEAGCQQDIRIVYADGTQQELRGVDICATRQLVMGEAAPGGMAAAGPGPGPGSGPMPGGPAPGGLMAGAPMPGGPMPGGPMPGNPMPGGPTLVLRNQGRLPVAAAFVSPSGRREWGENQLATRPLPPGETYRLRLPPGECIYDVKIIEINGAAQEQRGLDLCARPGVSFR